MDAPSASAGRKADFGDGRDAYEAKLGYAFKVVKLEKLPGKKVSRLI
jgi:hypothetical protein